MKVLVTGSRHYSNRRELHFWLSLFPISEIIHGGCQGADQLAAEYALEHNIPVTCFVADWSQGKKAGPLRNQRMIDECPFLVIAFPLEDSRGTYDCINRAKKAGIAVLEVGTAVSERMIE